MCVDLQQNKPGGHSGCAQEALNTTLFLALEVPEGNIQNSNKCVGNMQFISSLSH